MRNSCFQQLNFHRWTSQKTHMNQQFTCGYTLLWSCAMMQSMRRDVAAETLTEPCWSDHSGLPLVFPTLWGKSNDSKEHNQPPHIKKKEKKIVDWETKSSLISSVQPSMMKSHTEWPCSCLIFHDKLFLGGAELSMWWSTAPSSVQGPQSSSQQ